LISKMSQDDNIHLLHEYQKSRNKVCLLPIR
jgi:hypothetical protein